MRPGVIAVVVTILAVGSAAPALAQTEGAHPGVLRDLAPLFLQHPSSQTITTEGEPHVLTLSEADFHVIDEGSGGVDVYCTAAGTVAEMTSRPYSWSLGAGSHNVQCTATDATGNSTSIVYTVTVSVISDLFPAGDYEDRFTRIMGLNSLGNEVKAKIVVYFHRAGILNFDIEQDGNISPHPGDGNRWCTEDSNLFELGLMGSNLSAAHKKYCLEQLAENGIFRNIRI